VSAAVNVHEGVVENAVKPGAELLPAAQCRRRLQGLEEAILQHVFGQLWIGHFAADVGEELGTLSEQLQLEHRRITSVRR
jgi:hypothetical protein